MCIFVKNVLCNIVIAEEIFIQDFIYVKILEKNKTIRGKL